MPSNLLLVAFGEKKTYYINNSAMGYHTSCYRNILGQNAKVAVHNYRMLKPMSLDKTFMTKYSVRILGDKLVNLFKHMRFFIQEIGLQNHG